MKIKILSALSFFLLLFTEVYAAFPNENRVYDTNIRTVLMFRKGFEMAPPVMHLTQDEGLILSFDDLDGNMKKYKYTIVHCESDWKTSEEIKQSDYIDGYTEDYIVEAGYSFNTLVTYTHYTLSFPSESMKPTISGNYVIVVYLEDPGKPSFIKRFMVVERSALGVTGKINQATKMEDRLSKQKVDFTISYNGLKVYEPSRQIKVVVTQNDRWDNAIRDIKPRFVRNESLDYNYEDEISFQGGNEFRAFDIKSLVYQTERIRKIDKEGPVIVVYLLDDERRTFKRYVSEKDINGRKLVKNEERAENSDIEADYVWVVFTLPFDAYRSNGQIYLLGALTDWLLDTNSRMNFDFDRKVYTKSLLLKQGYYNYLYVFKDDNSPVADFSLVEGNHWETENEYTVWVYFREIGGQYDRLIATQDMNSLGQ